MNERYIQMLLMDEYLRRRNHVVAVPNSRDLMWSEVDLLSITKAGFAHEFEIKCSRADYNREIGENHKYNKANKHWRLQNPGAYANYSPPKVPNYFWFVTLQFEIEPPPYAGWILVDEWWPAWLDEPTLSIYVKKNAPRLHRGKWSDTEIAKIARLLSFRLLKAYKKEMS